MGIDWDYDFEKQGWDHGGCLNPKTVAAGKKALRECEENIGQVMTTTDGGWPRCGWGTVLDVDMKDGEPRVWIDGWMSASWAPWWMIHEVIPVRTEGPSHQRAQVPLRSVSEAPESPVSG